MTAQDPVADRVEGAVPESLRGSGQKIVHPLNHFAGGFVGEGEQEDLAGPVTLFEKPCDPIGEGACLAASRSRDHQMRSRPGGDRGQLLGIECPGEIDRRYVPCGGMEPVAPGHGAVEGAGLRCLR